METIAAIATAGAPAAIGVLRISGDGAFDALQAVFRPAGKPLAEQPPRTMIYGEMLDDHGRTADRGLAVRFAAPGSYTGEDSAELYCHGSPIVLQTVLEALFAHGVRQARAGEFTRRAFLNGRMDLTEAEAVMDLIDAQSADAARNAAAQVSGALRRRIEPIYERLMAVTARFYAVVDYPDEDIADIAPAEIAAAFTAAETELDALLRSFSRGKRMKNGVPTVIVGAPNAGKSSLLNALAGYERAIVTDVPGTTRDTVEETAVLGGTLLRLIDTAGLRETEDPIEKMGVARSRAALERAELALCVVELNAGGTAEDAEAMRLASRCPHWLYIRSKADLCPAGDAPLPLLPDGLARPPEGVIPLSSRTGAGLELLENAVGEIFPVGTQRSGEILTNPRQADAVQRALRAVRGANAALNGGLTPDAALTDAEAALSALGELTGKTAREDIVHNIFSRFCVGK